VKAVWLAPSTVDDYHVSLSRVRVSRRPTLCQDRTARVVVVSSGGLATSTKRAHSCDAERTLPNNSESNKRAVVKASLLSLIKYILRFKSEPLAKMCQIWHTSLWSTVPKRFRRSSMNRRRATSRCGSGIFSIIRGTSKADGKGALETQPERCNIFD